MTSEHTTMRGSSMPLAERITKALHDFTHARASMHIPVEATDVDVVLTDCATQIENLEAEHDALRQEHERLMEDYDAVVTLSNCYAEERDSLSRQVKIAVDAISILHASKHRWGNAWTREITQKALSEVESIQKEAKPACKHDHLDMDGICHVCGEDCRGIH